MGIILPFRSKQTVANGITGFFWAMPVSAQQRRIRELAHMLPANFIASLTRKPLDEVTAIIEGRL